MHQSKVRLPHARALLIATAVGILAACAPTGEGGQETLGGARAAPDTIVVAVGGEPRSLVPSIGSETPGPTEHLFEVLHQSLVSYDVSGQPIPKVARALPSLADGSWKLFPDGSMETVYQIREGVRWHDSRDLTADDIAFSWRLFNSSAVPVVSRRAARLIDNVEVRDSQTVAIHWRGRYAFASQLSGYELTLLPKHLLQDSLDLVPQQMAGHPYWQASFVGLGPYRLAHWYAGISLELEPVADYYLGPPRGAHISVRFLTDDSSTLAAVLGGGVDVVLPRRAALGITQALRQQWAVGGGSLILSPTYSWVFLAPQFLNPQPRGLGDPRIRQALAFAIDRAGVAEAVGGDASLASELWIAPSDPRYQPVASGIPRYQYRPERAAGLLRDAGWRPEGVDAVLVSHGERLEIELSTTAEWHSAAASVAESWRQVGVGVKEEVISLGSVFDRERRSTYSGVEMTGAFPSIGLLDSRLRSTNAPSAENLFVGSNRGRYASPELDGLLDRLWQAIGQSEIDAAESAIARKVAEDLPMIGVFFYPTIALVRDGVRNVRPPEVTPPVARPMFGWNAHEWSKG